MTDRAEPVRASRPPAGAEGPAAWRLLAGDDGDLAAESGATNMALDQALLESVAAGADPVVRLYRWAPATLSFGRNQPARGLYDEAAGHSRGVDFVRRPTGGQAVLHDDELTYAVIAPVALIGKPREAYRRINEALVTALLELGVEAELAPAVGARGEGNGRASGGDWLEACFRRPERGEVVVGGRKLVGSAQRTEGRTILQHGSILLGGTQAPAEELLVNGTRVVAAAEEGWTTLERELGRRPAPDGVRTAVVAGLEMALGIRLAPSRLTSAERAGARELRGRFASGEWTWRR